MTMTDKPPEEVLAEALERQGIPRYSGRANQFRAVLTAMPNYTLVRKDELERLRRLMAAADTQPLFAPSDRITDGYGNQREPRTPADYVEAYRDRLARALLDKEATDG